jgi:hypothetical protein
MHYPWPPSSLIDAHIPVHCSSMLMFHCRGPRFTRLLPCYCTALQYSHTSLSLDVQVLGHSIPASHHHHSSTLTFQLARLLTHAPLIQVLVPTVSMHTTCFVYMHTFTDLFTETRFDEFHEFGKGTHLFGSR